MYVVIAMYSMVACGTNKFMYTPVIYEMRTPELQGYRSMTFWRHPNTYVESVPSLSSNVLGTWTLTCDTLICIPKFWYYEKNGVFTYNVIVRGDSTIMSLPQRYVIHSNSLEDITDYSVIYESLGLKMEGNDYTSKAIRPKLYRRK